MCLCPSDATTTGAKLRGLNTTIDLLVAAAPMLALIASRSDVNKAAGGKLFVICFSEALAFDFQFKKSL